MRKVLAMLIVVTMLLTTLGGITVFSALEDAVAVDVVANVIDNGVTVSYWNNAKCDGTYLYNLGNDGTDGKVAEDEYSYAITFNNSAKTFTLNNPSTTPFDAETIVFPYQVKYNSVTYTFSGAFTSTYFLCGGSSSGVSAVKNIYISEGITILGASKNGGSFRNGKSVEKVILPSTLKQISSGNMFMSCSALTEIELPSGLTTIAGQSFSGSGIKEITMPASITSLGDGLFYNTPLEYIHFEEGFVWPKNTIPSSTFRACPSLKDFVIPDYITSLGASLTFSGCNSLTEIVIPAGVTVIPNQGFANCKGLQKVVIKGPVTEMQYRAFISAPLKEGVTFEGKTAPATMADQVFSASGLIVNYPADGVGYDSADWQANFPAGTTFVRAEGEPSVQNLTLTGKTIMGGSLTAEYDYVDPMDRAESGSTVTWTSCENADFASSEVFTLKTESCNGNTAMIYEIQETDDGKYIRCTVTPRNADATLNVGTPVSATTATAVRAPQTVPAVTLTAPSNGYYASVNSAITLSADASCDLTTITKVEFYVNDAKVGEDSEAPYEISWTPDEMGTATIYAKAYNAIDEDGSSASASVNVLAEGADTSSYITTTFTAPVADSVHLSSGSVTFTGTAVESSGSNISSVEIFANGKSIGTDTKGDFSITAKLDPGTYSIIAVVKSADGKSGTSTAFNITVSGMGFTTMIANDMVLQRNKPLKLSGIGVDGTVVTAELLDKTASATVSGGKWTVTLPPMPATKSTTLKFTANDGTSKEFTNVAIGEVIMCSGQSNIAGGMGNTYSEYREKDYPDIRMFFPSSMYLESSTPQNDIEGGQWRIGTKENAKNFATVGWLAAHTLYNNTNGEVPIGLVWAAVGGTSIQAWVPSGTYSNDPDLKKINTNPTRYNAYVTPWLGFTIGHIIWYQGESNCFHNQNYEKNMTAYIDAYRKAFDDETMKFIVVCLPTYDAPAGYNNPLRSFTHVREGQFNVSKYIDGVASVVSVDTGVSNGIHPSDKLPIAQRAAAAIEHFAWPDSDVVWQSPEFDSMTVENGKAILTFKNIGSGLTTTDGTAPKAFKLMDNSGVFQDVEATLVGNTVEIDVSAITGEVKIRYAYEDVPAQVGVKSGVNLINNEGFPMAPFRTDNDRTHFATYDSATGVYSDPINFAPMVRSITASDLEEGTSTITINARDYDDSIQSVEVFVDGTSVGQATQAAYDTWTYDWTDATEGKHEIYVIATDELGTTNAKGHSTLGSVTVTPVKYAVNLATAVPSLFGKFTNLSNAELDNFGGADGVKITTTGEGKLILAAYNGNMLVKCVLTDEKTASLTAAEIGDATIIKAFLFENMTNIRPVAATPATINK